MASLDEFAHVAEEEGQNQSGNVASVHIGIGHDDYLVVTKFLHVQCLVVFIGADGNAEGGIDILDFLAVEGFVLRGFLYIQDLTAQGQDGLEMGVTALLGGTACRVTLHEVELALFGHLRGAVRQFAGQTASAESRLALY